jgi:hypothetical protein
MFWRIIIETVIVHTITYFIVGFSAFTLFKYTSTLSDPKNNMRPATDLIVRAGTLFQPVRGVLFGIVFYLINDILFQQSEGWLIIWIMLVAIGILSTFAPAASSIEGFIYLKSDYGRNWGGLIEILVQSFLLSIITFYWVNHSQIILLNWIMGILFAIVLVLPVLGLLVNPKKQNSPATE